MAEGKAQHRFLSIINSLNREDEKVEFLDWVRDYIENQECCTSKKGCSKPQCTKQQGKRVTKAEILLSCIQTAIKEKVPFNAVMESEKIHFPTVGEDVNLDEKNCVHVDAFLYDEDAVDALVEGGQLLNAYCKQCGSSDTEAITFITHSMSVERLKFLFEDALPNLKGKTLVDVGSRLGPVLYGAHVYSKAENIIGIEMNTELCDLQKAIVARFKLGKRIQVVEGDVLDHADVLAKADVAVLNNVFEWFTQVEQQNQMWQFLRNSIPKGCIVVASPPIEKTFKFLNTEIEVSEWLGEMDVSPYNQLFIEENDLAFYKVV